MKRERMKALSFYIIFQNSVHYCITKVLAIRYASDQKNYSISSVHNIKLHIYNDHARFVVLNQQSCKTKTKKYASFKLYRGAIFLLSHEQHKTQFSQSPSFYFYIHSMSLHFTGFFFWSPLCLFSSYYLLTVSVQCRSCLIQKQHFGIPH
jgi:hypothetical protein